MVESTAVTVTPVLTSQQANMVVIVLARKDYNCDNKSENAILRWSPACYIQHYNIRVQ